MKGATKAELIGLLEEEAWHRGAADRKAAKLESLLSIAIVYVECYAGRFPDNVRPEHLKAFRKWRDGYEK